MILTEAEARQKWCPHVRMGSVGHNRWSDTSDPIGLAGCECVASSCMSWCWAETFWQYDHAEARPEGEGWKQGPHPGSPGVTVWKRPKEPRGYCGLASRGGQP